MIQEVHDLAGQHETIAENLSTSIIREVHAMLQDLKQERKKVCVAIADPQKTSSTSGELSL